MRYLNTSDYRYTIQWSQLNQLLQIPGIGGAPLNTMPGNDAKLLQAERIAIDEVSSYLRQRWDINREFTSLEPWSYTASYSEENRVILDYATFSSSTAYATGSCVISSGVAYMSLGNGATTSTPVAGANWVELGNQYDIYYVKPIYPVYNDTTYYTMGDVVYWAGHTWSSNYTTIAITPDMMIQYKRLEWVPDPNVLPTSNMNSEGKYWSDGGTFSVSGIYPTNTTYWQLGDNRCKQIMMAVQDITLYLLSKSISPANIPELRQAAYTNAIKMLKSAANGEITLSMPELEPTQGLKTRYFGDVRKTNNL